MVQTERIKKDLGNAILYMSDKQTARIVFNEYVSSQVKASKTLEKMKKGYSWEETNKKIMDTDQTSNMTNSQMDISFSLLNGL